MQLVLSSFFFASTALLLAGCDTYHYVSGTLHEDARRPQKAIKHYEAFLSSRPKDPRACEVRLRAAQLYRSIFLRCRDARAHYEAAARDFPRTPSCVARAKEGLLLCPDYFPTDPGLTWVYVDSASGGKAMRLEWEARASAGPTGAISSALYAGNKRVASKIERYVRADWAVWRIDQGTREAILRYPYNENMSWTASRGRSKVEYLVVSSATVVRTAAGEFSDCLKIREKDSAYSFSWKYDYYCPGVGKVKTTVGGRGFENPNTELLRFGRIE